VEVYWRGRVLAFLRPRQARSVSALACLRFSKANSQAILVGTMPTLRGPEIRLLNILHEDADLLVLNKPAGLVCHPTKGSAYSSLVGRVRVYMRSAGVHLVNRLDRETSGVVLAARNAATAGELGRIWENRSVAKEYLAIVHGHVRTEAGLIDAPLGKDTASAVAIKDCVRPDGVPARTEFIVQQRFENESGAFSLVKAVPLTGRKHQIRIHFAHIGHPVVGDKIYGGDERLYLRFVTGQLEPEDWRRLLVPYHALHAAGLRFEWRGKSHEFRAEPERWFSAFVSAA
jgi:23S rRNA pseudouridine1911/1915/1917 synthase